METVEYHQIIQFLTALGIGFLIGLERERRQKYEIFAGVRTLPLVALCGALIYDFFPDVFIFGFVFLGGLILIGYFSKIQTLDVGMTTSVSILLTYIFGAMCTYSRDAMILAVMLAIITTTLLAIKDPLHSFANQIDPDEMFAVLKFLGVSLVIFPLIPNRPVDYLFGLNPRFVWLMVIFVSGIGFGAYVLTKVLGPRTGIGLSGLLGGFISSTATTVAMSQKSIEESRLSSVASLAIVIACVAMFPRMLIELAVVYPELLKDVIVPVSVMVVLSLIPSVYLLWITTTEEIPDIDQENPFRLQPALMFGAIFAVVLLVSQYAHELYGNTGIMITAIISGLADVDAITLSVGRLTQEGELKANTAGKAIVLGAISNTVLKVGYTWVMGNRKLAVRVSSVMGVSIMGGILCVVFF